MNEPTDHESILLLTKAVDTLGNRLDEKLLELKEDIRELKDNYASRLTNAEQRLINIDKVKVAKEEQDIINREIELRIRCNEINVTRIMTWGSAIVIIISIAEFILIKYF